MNICFLVCFLNLWGPIVYYVPGVGGGGVQKSVVYENCTPLKEFHMKIVLPLATRIFKMHPPPSTPTFPRPRVLKI